MNLVMLSQLEPIVCGKQRYLFASCDFFRQQVIVLCNKPTAIAMSGICGSESS